MSTLQLSRHYIPCAKLKVKQATGPAGPAGPAPAALVSDGLRRWVTVPSFEEGTGVWTFSALATELERNVRERFFKSKPLLRGGVAAPIKQIERYRTVIGAAGEVRRIPVA